LASSTLIFDGSLTLPVTDNDGQAVAADGREPTVDIGFLVRLLTFRTVLGRRSQPSALALYANLLRSWTLSKQADHGALNAK
jgi:hypothetical protein